MIFPNTEHPNWFSGNSPGNCSFQRLQLEFIRVRLQLLCVTALCHARLGAPPTVPLSFGSCAICRAEEDRKGGAKLKISSNIKQLKAVVKIYKEQVVWTKGALFCVTILGHFASLQTFGLLFSFRTFFVVSDFRES